MRRFAALLAVSLLSCSAPKKPPTPPPAAKFASGTLAVEVDPPDAEVEVDGSPRGPAADLKTITLAPGAHQIVIRKTGFEIWRGEVEIHTQTETIQVKLVPKK